MDPKPTSAAPSPLKLLTTKGHLFVPSNRGKERSNVAAINPGRNCLPDETQLAQNGVCWLNPPLRITEP